MTKWFYIILLLCSFTLVGCQNFNETDSKQIDETDSKQFNECSYETEYHVGKECLDFVYIRDGLFEFDGELFFPRAWPSDEINLPYGKDNKPQTFAEFKGLMIKRFGNPGSDKLQPRLGEVIDKNSWKHLKDGFFKDSQNVYCEYNMSSGSYLKVIKELNGDALIFLSDPDDNSSVVDFDSSYDELTIRTSSFATDGDNIFDYKCRKVTLD